MPVRRLLIVGLVIAATTASTRLAAQDTAAIRGADRRAAAECAVEQPTAPVVVDGVTLCRVRGISSCPPERRAAEIAKRITDVAANRANILDVFNEYGVQIMTPAYERDPEQAKVVPRDQWFMSPAALPTSIPERVVEPPMAAPPADVSLATRRDGESSTVPAWPAKKS